MSVRIIDWNYAFDDSVGLYSSSEDPEFPLTNLTKFSRERVFRTSGYFVVSSSNNKLSFKESSGGSELIATIASGEYTPDELEAEIKFQMENAGAQTYTVTFSASTGHWTIASDGTYFALLIATATSPSNSILTSIGYSTNDYSSGDLSYTSPQIALHTEEWVLLDLRTWGTNPIDSFVLLFSKSAGNSLTSFATIKLQANQTPDFSSPSVNQTLTLDETWQSASHFFSTANNYRYWRVQIVDPSNPNLYIEIPKIVLGYSAQLTQEPEVGISQSEKDSSQNQENSYGNRYSDLYPVRRLLSFGYKVLQDTDKQILRNIFRRNGNSSPITVAIDPEEDIFATKDENIFYGTLVGDFKATQLAFSYFDLSFEMEETI